ncbi:MAG: BamA/TamA family outer membrane protein [Ignavibacteriales bacterium]|nr:BamA/TamA family outer membrane protein [Ignavibacteriales bacterium]
MSKKALTYTKPFVLYGWLFLFIPSVAAAQSQQRVASAEFYGNDRYSQRELTAASLVTSGDGNLTNKLDRVKIAITELYRKEGFYNFRFDSIHVEQSDDSSTVRLIFYMHEGLQTTIQAIEFSGNNSVPASQLFAMMETKAGKPLNESILESDIRSILDHYSNAGRPFAKISSDSISPDRADSSRLLLSLIIDEGPQVFLNELQIDGNTSTKTVVITREARLEQFELFQQEKLDRIKKRLVRMQLFSSVSEPQLYIAAAAAPDSLIGGLAIFVKEGNTNTFDGIVGYVPSNTPSTKGYFTGDVFVAFKNLFGTGRRAFVKWKRENELTQELELQYREPWLFGIPLSVNGAFFQRKQDSSYVKTKLELRAELAVTDELTLGTNILNEATYPAADLKRFSVFESNIFSVGGEILYDTRDNLLSPVNGIRYSTTVQQGIKEITGPQQYLSPALERNYSIQKYSLDAEGYISIFLRQVIMIGIHGKQVTSSRLELSDLYQFGGTTTLRGYRENQFFASKIAWINLEYRFLTGRASSLYGFMDGGYYFRPADALKLVIAQESSLYGYGFGARIETGLGILNVNYALGEGDSFSNGKIHVGIINEF